MSTYCKNPLFLNLRMLGGGTTAALRAARAAGFDEVELRPSSDGPGQDSAPELVRALEEEHLRVTDYQLIADFDGACDARRGPKRIEAIATLDAAVRLRAGTVLVSASSHPDCIPSRVDDDMRWIAHEAARRHLRVAYEPTATSTFNATVPSAWQCVRRVHEPNLGLALDIFHIFAGGRTDSDLNGIPVERVFLVQLSDLARGVAYRTVAETAQHHRLLPGDGRFPIQSILDRLRSEGYAGPIGVKAFNDCMRARPAVEVAREAMASLIRVWVR